MKNEYYEQREIWNKSPQTYQIQMLSDLLNLIPEGIENVLDVGCGNGFISNALPKNIRVVGVDISREALRYVEHLKLVSSVAHLPFRKESFDLVQATDVIEHISEPNYSKTLEEIQRIAKRYILIGVPLMENISSGLTKCDVCGMVFHINYHCRSFGIVELGHLFKEGWIPKTIVFSGETLRLQELYFRVLRSLLGVFNEGDLAICHKCGSKGSKTNADDKIEYSLATLARYASRKCALFHPDRSECLVLYEREGSSAISEGNGEGFKLVSSKGNKLEVVPTKIIKRDNNLVMESTSFRRRNLDDLFWLELRSEERIYRYPNPTWISSNQLCIPTWFSSDHLKTLSPSHGLWTCDKSKEILLSAVQGIADDLRFRRHLKGMLYTVLERLGLKEV